jgi:membrane protein DedA with SNARE-associated domain/rhodanese-related sulfurtransferase
MIHPAEMLSGRWGLLFVFLNVLVEQLGLPLPATPTLLLAGAIAVIHPEWGIAVVVLVTAACIATDVGWYYAGRTYGNRLMRLLCRISLSPDSCVRDTHEHFERWGVNALLFAKFVPGLATVAPPLAGALRIRFGRFLRMTSLGSVLWVVTLMALGAVAAPRIIALLPRIGQFGGRAAVFIGLLLALYVLLRWLQRKRFLHALRMARVDVHELESMMGGEPPPVVLDVRSVSQVQLDPRVIPGAVHVPLEDIGPHLASIKQAGEVVVYCNCPNEFSAARVARLLMKNGVVRVRPLQGGLDAWVAAGCPVQTHASPAVVGAPRLASGT